MKRKNKTKNLALQGNVMWFVESDKLSIKHWQKRLHNAIKVKSTNHNSGYTTCYNKRENCENLFLQIKIGLGFAGSWMVEKVASIFGILLRKTFTFTLEDSVVINSKTHSNHSKTQTIGCWNDDFFCSVVIGKFKQQKNCDVIVCKQPL